MQEKERRWAGREEEGKGRRKGRIREKRRGGREMVSGEEGRRTEGLQKRDLIHA